MLGLGSRRARRVDWISPGREFTADNPLGLDNFTRIVVHGETLSFEYLRLTIDHHANDLFSWERVALPEG